MRGLLVSDGACSSGAGIGAGGGISMPGMCWCCAAAGADKEASASALAAAEKPCFKTRTPMGGAARVSGASVQLV